MNKMGKTTSTPKLRFPEFKSTAIGFEKGNVIFEPISNKNHDSDLPVLAITQEYGAIPRDQIDYNVSVTDKSLENYKIVEIGDFIISLRSFQGGIEYSLYHGICSPAYVVLRKKIDIVEQYYKHYFKTSKFIQDLNKDLEGIRDGKMVSYSQFSAILLPKPENEEQQKISDCLSSLDDLIAAEDKKLEALKAHKKGLMQKLFPTEGKTVPEWRFSEFRDCENWKVIPLANIGDIVTGRTPNTENELLWNGDIQFVTPTDITENKYIIKTQRNITNDGKNRILPKNTIMYTCIASIGKMALSVYPCVTNQQINSIIPFDNYISDFVFYVLESISRQVSLLAGKQAVPIINKTLFSTIKVGVPKKNEQQKIADCFYSLDNLIFAQIEKIEALKLHKKGLMQGLFYSIEEVDE